MDASTFLSRLDDSTLTSVDRALALLWFVGRDENQAGMSSKDICKLVEGCGHPRQNVSRLEAQLSADRQVSRVPGSNAWRLHPKSRRQLNSVYTTTVGAPTRVIETSSVLPQAMFANTRSYIEKVVFQVNAAYDYGLYDASSVMCRRLLETLIIEVYEAVDRPEDITAPNGRYYMFADLIRILLGDRSLRISRNGQQGLQDLKRLGDLAAHNRRFNARREDIDRLRDGVRVAAEELLHLAKLA